MKKTLKISVLCFCMIAAFSCGDKYENYGISHRYTYQSSDGTGLAPMLNYIISYELIFNASDDGAAKTKFEEHTLSFTQEGLQAKLEEILGDSATGSVTVKYYLYKLEGDNTKHIDSTELYTAEKN